MRADQWLWAARFFKTRSLAKQAIDGGKIEVNGARCKPAKAVHVGDILSISRGSERIEVAVAVLSDKRGPAPVAAAMYAETEASVVRREREREAQRLSRMAYQPPEGRPSKRDRRDIFAFERQHGASESDDS
ncbi:MAG: RNA-binding protein [Rhodanobacteraceae bacterium]|nr:RNA-binding protein [Rhodanobacteraceae bacterium]